MLTDTEYTEVRARLDAYNVWAKQFLKPNGWTVIPADAVPPVEVSNEDRSAVEVYRFLHDKPEKYFAYVQRPDAVPASVAPRDIRRPSESALHGRTGKLTTWTGDYLGTITFGRCWRDSFGGTRVPVSVYAITGDTYHGTYFASTGDFARIRKAKRKAA